jgi:hypothetical protein
MAKLTVGGSSREKNADLPGAIPRLKSTVSLLPLVMLDEVFRNCAYVSVGSDIRALMAEYMAHVRDVHRVTSPTPELRIQAMVAVREQQTQTD